MKNPKKSNFLEWNNNILADSLKKINLNFILIIILDAIFYLLSGYLIIFWLQRIQEKMAAFNLPADVISLGYERAQQLVGEAKSFYYLIIFSFVLLLIAIIFLASIFKGAIWAKVTKAKITFKLISKFFVLNLVWMGFWFIMVILISYLVEPALAPRFMIAAIILGLYFTNTLYTIFMKKIELNSIINAVKLNILKIHLFLLPYALISLFFYVLVKLTSLLSQKYSLIVLGIVAIFYAALARYYASALVSSIQEK